MHKTDEKVKRILILTLGTGDLSNASKDAGYRSVQYIIENETYKKNGFIKKCAFVAEPIINSYVPDEIFILGTVKSLWHQFYASIVSCDYEDKTYLENKNYKRLVDIEQNEEYGINTDIQELKNLSFEISEIYNDLDECSWIKYSDSYKIKKPRIHIMLTKYGICDEELKENYDVLIEMEKYLDEKYKYEVAFDITHSFRSLPIYNLIIFNFIGNITKHNIKISHIYYGNYDASHELDGTAPIVDLKDIVEVLDMTGGVTEFKNTGNASSIILLINKDKELSKVLKRFDISTQLNSFDNIKNFLKDLTKVVNQKTDESRYTGVRKMIKTVLDEKFFDGRINEIEELTDIDIKFMLMEWFFNQNRIGLGLATGLEVLRDINTPAYLEAKGYDIKKDDITYRISAESYFCNDIPKKLRELDRKLSRIEEIVCEFGEELRTYKCLRNIFAHSLDSEKNLELSKAEKEELLLIIYGDESKLNFFRNSIKKIKVEFDINRDNYVEIFKTPKKKNDSKHKTLTCDDCRIILDFVGNCCYEGYSFSKTSGHKYDIYYLNKNVRKLFFGALGNIKNYEVQKRAFFVLKYLKKSFDNFRNYKSIDIVLYRCDNIEIEVIFRNLIEVLQQSDNRISISHIRKEGIDTLKYSKCRKNTTFIDYVKYKESFEDDITLKNEIFEIPFEYLCGE